MYKIVLWVIDNFWGKKMQLTIDEKLKNKCINNTAVAIPTSLYTSKIIGKDKEFESKIYSNSLSSNAIMDIWNKQHPLIHTWLLLSSISICFLSALLFIVLK